MLACWPAPNFIRLLISAPLLLFSVPTFAAPGAYTGSLLEDHQAVNLKALRVVEVGDEDRRPANKYALEHQMSTAEVEQRYSATGDIICRTSSASGQVTVARDIVTTAAHLFAKENVCPPKETAQSCKFILRVGGEDQTYLIKEIVGTGWPCPVKEERRLGEDWTVLRLVKPVDRRVTPYPIPQTSGRAITHGDSVTLVAKSADWPSAKYINFHARPRHYGDCKVQLSMQWGTHGYMETDCDWSHGASGGSMLTQGEKPVLMATVVGSSHGDVGPECKGLTEHRKQGEYISNCWAGWTTSVTGVYAQTILDAAHINQKVDMEPPPNNWDFGGVFKPMIKPPSAPATQKPAAAPFGGFRLPKVRM